MEIKGTNVTIMVKDMDKAISFYQNLGLHLKQRWGDHYAMVETTGITIGIHPAKDNELDSGSISIGFMIDKIEDGKELLTKNDVVYIEENDGKSGNYLHFKDPDGTVLYFVQPKW